MGADEPLSPLGRPRPRMERALGREITPRRAARLIAGASLFLTVTAGLAAWLVDKKDFGSLRDSLWWALQTVTTVGYGDVVPEHTSGRLIGAVLMLNGIALLTVVTAAITAMLIEQARQRRRASDEEVLAKLEGIESRLAELSARIPPSD
jgi:voltage-gated potassium channel